VAVRLGIVIVHYNTPDDLGRCLASLRDQAPGCTHEIVVVDNASTAPGLEALQDGYPEVRWLVNAENIGYARGCNQGLASISADYHLLLNPDIVVRPGAIDALLDFADRTPRAGIIGPQLLNEDGTVQESCRRFYTFGTLLLRRTVLGKLFPDSGIVRRHLMRDFDHASVRPVDWVLGGCLLVRREALARCGAMDERFFLYFEDVDWCYRMWQSGFEVVYCPDARFVHRHRRSSASGTFNRSFWLHLGSLISFYEKWSLVVYAAKKWRRPLAVALHWLLDMVLLSAALLGAYSARLIAQPLFTEDLLPLRWYGGWLGYAAVLVTVAFAMLGRYRSSRQSDRPAWSEHLKQMGLVALLLLAGSYLGRDDVVSRAVLITLVVLYTGLTAWANHLVGRILRRLETGYLALERTLLVGPRDALASWLARVGEPRRLGIDVVGYATREPADAGGHPAIGAGGVPWLGAPDDLVGLSDRFRVSQVAFWQSPPAAGVAAGVLARLRRARIRMRWIVDDAWLLAAGARAERFGEADSGVLEPDDGEILRRWAWRPLEIVLAAVLAPAVLVALPRNRLDRRAGRSRTETVDIGGVASDHGAASREVAVDGRPLALWRQPGLIGALLLGRVGIVGGPLGHPEPGADLAQVLRGSGAARPGLTGAWATTRGRGLLATLWQTPGGWGQSEEPPGGSTARADGQEVQTP
jgi:GT2 family glycosyltransferase